MSGPCFFSSALCAGSDDDEDIDDALATSSIDVDVSSTLCSRISPCIHHASPCLAGPALVDDEIGSDCSDSDAEDACSTMSGPSSVDDSTVVSTIAAPVSCLKGSGASRNQDLNLFWDPNVQIIAYHAMHDRADVDVQPDWKPTKPRCGKRATDSAKLAAFDRRAGLQLYQLACAISRARCMALLVGHSVSHGWPVTWEDDVACIFHPPADGVIDVSCIGRPMHSTDCVEISRNDALCALHSRWNSCLHMGETPTWDDLNARNATQSNTFSIALFDVVLTHGDDDASCVVPAMPCPEASSMKPIRVKRWLMDSGTSLDLLDKRSVRPANREFVHNIDTIKLATANGVTEAQRGIHLHVGVLDTSIAPVVLDKTPNAMSLGRRVVDDGYTWHWEGRTLEPYLVHVDTKERIALEVDDYCPYLEDDGQTYAFHANGAPDDGGTCCVSMPAPSSSSSSSSSIAPHPSAMHVDEPRIEDGAKPPGGDAGSGQAVCIPSGHCEPSGNVAASTAGGFDAGSGQAVSKPSGHCEPSGNAAASGAGDIGPKGDYG